MFLMMICIHQQLPKFMLALHWNQIGVSCSLCIGIDWRLHAHYALDNSPGCVSVTSRANL